MDAYFERLGPSAFRSSEHVGGAWEPDEMHVGPVFGLLAHLVEADRDARRDDGLVIGRLSYDILGTIPLGEVEVTVEVLRPGRSVELVEARLAHAGRDAIRLRAWLLATRDTRPIADVALAPLPPPDDIPPWPAGEAWPGGFIASLDVRRVLRGPGDGFAWVRTSLPLVAGEPSSPLAHVAGLMDVANGMTVRVDPRRVAFPNLDLTAHFFVQPQGEWLGIQTVVSFGPDGAGLTRSVLHDTRGPIGALALLLTLRPTGTTSADDGRGGIDGT